MKKFLLFLGLLPMAASAQTITQATHQPIAGDTNSQVMLGGTPNIGNTGTNQIFDNSALTPSAGATVQYVAPTAAETTTYPGTTLKQTDAAGTSAVFYKMTPSAMEITGVVTPDFTLNLNTDNAKILTFPAGYAYTLTDNAKGSFTSSVASGLVSGTVNTTVDAVGTMIVGSTNMPNVLRVKTVQNFNLYSPQDTFYMMPIGNMTSTSYQFYSAASKFPLLATSTVALSVPLAGINQNQVVTTAAQSSFLATKEAAASSGVSLYPNPAAERITVSGVAARTPYEILNMEGRLVKHGTLEGQQIGIETLSSGMYYLVLKTKKENIKLALIKK